MQIAYEMDIPQNRDIVHHFESKISYKFTQTLNKRYKITDAPDIVAGSSKQLPISNSQNKRKFDNISTEILLPILCGKRKSSDK